MTICNCSLAGTKACLVCPNNGWSASWYSISIPAVINTERYELVEKKDWKKKVLEKKMKEIEETTNSYKNQIIWLTEEVEKLQKEADGYKKDLKELKE